MSLRVHLWAGLKRLTGGEEVVEVEAATIGQMLDALAEKHPGLAPVLKEGVSVAIDGEIVNGARHRALDEGVEIYLMQRIKGG